MAEKSKKTGSPEAVDVAASVRNLKKWLKSLKVKTELKIPTEDIPLGLKYGIWYLDYLRCQNFPQSVTAEHLTILNVIAELSVKADPDGASSSGEPFVQKIEKTNASYKLKGKIKKDDLPEPKLNGVVAGPKRGARKLVPLSDAMNKLNIQGYKGCGCKGTCQTKICGCKKRNMQCGASCKCSEGCYNKGAKEESIEENAETDDINETDKKGDEINKDDSVEGSEKSCDDSSSSDEDLDKYYWMKENVDWNEHIASLVQCPKCPRTFLPSRVMYHAKVCRKYV